MIDLNPYISLTTMMVLATRDFYFQSKTFREHSKHIERSNSVAWSVINTEKYEKSDDDKKWLQFIWVAEMLTWKEAEKVQTELYYMIYKCTPSKVKIWDETLYGWEGKVIEFK